MNLDDLTIKEIKDLKALLSRPSKPITEKELGVHIAILQRGWIFVGYLYKKGHEYTLKKAQCVRIWGTTKGLGEIALNGPTSATRLDASGDVKFHELVSVGLMKCEDSKWVTTLDN